MAFSIGISDKVIKLGLKNFNGVQRRFNFLFEINKVPLFDDYAHHPTEISSVLDGVSKVYYKKNSLHFPTTQSFKSKKLKK